MKPLHAIGPLTVAGIIMFATGANAANYSFTEEFRFSDGALPTSSFMRTEPYGLAIMFR